MKEVETGREDKDNSEKAKESLTMAVDPYERLALRLYLTL